MINWIENSTLEDYENTRKYLSLFLTTSEIDFLIKMYDRSSFVEYSFNNIYRASCISLSELEFNQYNDKIDEEMQKIINGDPITPILLVKDKQNAKVLISNGFFKLFAIHYINKDEKLRCKIV